MIASKQIAENYVETGRKKAELPVSHMLILGFFAGMFIALAGAGASVASAAMTNASASRIASALVFPSGLALVVCTGAELFTGNCLMTISALQKRISVGELFKNLLFVYLGNLIGAIFVAVLICLRAYSKPVRRRSGAGSSEYSRFQGDPDFAGGAVPCDPL